LALLTDKPLSKTGTTAREKQAHGKNRKAARAFVRPGGFSNLPF
jgi:hypothetical protein